MKAKQSGKVDVSEWTFLTGKDHDSLNTLIARGVCDAVASTLKVHGVDLSVEAVFDEDDETDSKPAQFFICARLPFGSVVLDDLVFRVPLGKALQECADHTGLIKDSLDQMVRRIKES